MPGTKHTPARRKGRRRATKTIPKSRKIPELTGPPDVLEQLRDADDLRLSTGDDAVSLPFSKEIIQFLLDLKDEEDAIVFSGEEALTPAQAADLLKVSRPHVTALIKAGAIPDHMVGSHHRVLVRDIHAFLQRREAQQAALREMAEIVEAEDGYRSRR